MKMIEHNHFICHFIFGGHLLNIPIQRHKKSPETNFSEQVRKLISGLSI